MSIVARRILVSIAGALIVLMAVSPYLHWGPAVLSFIPMWSGGLLLMKGAETIFPPATGQNLNTNDRDLFLSLSAVGLALATALSLVMCFWSRPVQQKAITLTYLFFLIVLVSISTANFAALDALLNRKAQAFIDLVLVIVASVTMTALIHLKPSSPSGIVTRAIVVFLLTLQGIALPAIYGLLWLLNWENALTATQTRSFNPSWISALAAVASAVTATLNYQHTKQEATKPTSRIVLG